MRWLIVLLYLVVFAAVGLYAFQNPPQATVKFAVWSIPVQLWWPAAVVAAASLVLAVMQAIRYAVVISWHRGRSQLASRAREGRP